MIPIPWHIAKQDGKFCVIKNGTDEKEGCHPTRGDAVDQIRALYANESEMAIQEFCGMEDFNMDGGEDHLGQAIAAFDQVYAMHSEWMKSGATPSKEAKLAFAYLLDSVKHHLYAAIESQKAPEEMPDDSYHEDYAVIAPKAGVAEFAWEGPIAFEGVLTGDKRFFQHGSMEWNTERSIPFRWQKSSIEGHKGAVPIGRVDKIERKMDGTIYGFGVIIPSLNEEAAEYLRLMEAGVASGVSVDGDSATYDTTQLADGSQRVDFSKMRIRGLTAVDIPAFSEANVDLTTEEAASDDVEELAKKKKKKMAIGNRAHTWMSDGLTASAIPVAPPTEWFVDPQFDGPTPITVSKDGKVFGHLALFDTCHIGLPGCVTPPKGGSYQYFHTGEIETAEGDSVGVGHLTFNTGHAGLAANAKTAAAHYDHTGTVAADVRVGEDQHGVWVAGALRSHLTDEDLRTFRAAPLSGDWRKIAGRLELVGALAVNVPGFPVPRTRTLVASGETETLLTFIEAEDALENRRTELALRVGIELADKTEGGAKFPAEAYAYVPDPDMPSTWKLRLWATPGGGPDARIVGAAIAALGKGFRGNKVEIPADALGGVKEKILAAWKSVHPDYKEEDIPAVLK